ncbi:MAG: hypothetical protein GY915_08630 [bacterium]|nr:hypothetical protein [bacterium]
MAFYSAWCEKGEDFDPQKHAIQQIPIFHLLISMAENEKPQAKITTKAKCFHEDIQDLTQPCVMISQASSEEDEVKLIFRGALKALPESRKEGGLVTLTFEAYLEDLEVWQTECMEDLKRAPFHEPLLDREGTPSTQVFKDLLEAHGLGAHIPPTGGREGTLRPLLATSENAIVLDDSVLLFPLTQKMVRDPISRMTIHVSTQWRQVFSGSADISHRLKMAFRDGLISTFSGEDLKRRWWKKDYKAKKSGYWVEESALEEVPGTSTGILRLYPEGDATKGKKLSWFRPRVRLGWKYIQKRREEAMGVLQNNALNSDKEGTLHLKIRPLESRKVDTPWAPRWRYSRKFHITSGTRVFSCTQNHVSSDSFEEDLEKGLWKDKGSRDRFCPLTRRGTFLESDRGRQVMDYALNQAQRLLERSARSFEITVRVSFEKGMTISCGDSILLQSAQVPGGEVFGTLTHLVWHADGDKGTAWAELKVCATVGRGGELQDFKDSQIIEEDLLYVETGIWNPEYTFQKNIPAQGEGGTVSYVLIPRGPKDLFSSPGILRAEDMIQRVYVKNDAYEQQRNLNEINPTSLRIRLRDLHGVEEFVQRVNINISNDFYVPSRHRQVNGKTKNF